MSTQPYTVATALETIATCQLAGVSMAEARAFITAQVPLATVRATLLERRVAAAEPEINAHHASKSGTPAERAWDATLAEINKGKP
jgi:hypothetical protein